MFDNWVLLSSVFLLHVLKHFLDCVREWKAIHTIHLFLFLSHHHESLLEPFICIQLFFIINLIWNLSPKPHPNLTPFFSYCS
jgi:hypothetical protein